MEIDLKAVTAAQMRDIELRSVEAEVALDRLMENAGLAVARAIARYLDGSFGKNISVLVGPGNNGSDGLVAARHLVKWGAKVTAFGLTKRPEPDDKRELAADEGVNFVSLFSNEASGDEYRRRLSHSNVVIDAVLGTGQARPIDQNLANLLRAAGEVAAPVIAIDVPTGVDSNTGRFDENGLQSDLTLMLGYPKIGPLISAGSGACGEIQVLDIGIPADLASDVNTEWLSADLARILLPERSGDTNKGSFGKTLTVAGSRNYLGAPLLSTQAAVRSGTGLIYLATPDSVYDRIGGTVEEAIYLPLEENSNGHLNASVAIRQLSAQLEGMNSVLIGPGLGQSSQAIQLVEGIIRNLPEQVPTVLDADALNVASRMLRWSEIIAPPVVLTPHPGEMARLLGISVAQVQEDRQSAAHEAANRFNAVVVLKGAATLIAAPDGRLRISPWVNSGLAKGGTGDVLAGLIAGLVAQSPENLFDMASLAVYVHGLAGELAKRELGERGMTAGDVARMIPKAFMELELPSA